MGGAGTPPPPPPPLELAGRPERGALQGVGGHLGTALHEGGPRGAAAVPALPPGPPRRFAAASATSARPTQQHPPHADAGTEKGGRGLVSPEEEQRKRQPPPFLLRGDETTQKERAAVVAVAFVVGIGFVDAEQRSHRHGRVREDGRARRTRERGNGKKINENAKTTPTAGDHPPTASTTHPPNTRHSKKTVRNRHNLFKCTVKHKNKSSLV
mmetsp:Transcript_110720/g.226551  ORF Transcript_110720/g.226551 Transcript_110720/m.226551 type:complete len:212 (-) Transcript_110720:18-653(-)